MGKKFHVVSYPINNRLDINIVLVKKNMNSYMGMKEFNNDLPPLRTLNIKNQNLSYLLNNVETWSAWPLYQTRISCKKTYQMTRCDQCKPMHWFVGQTHRHF